MPKLYKKHTATQTIMPKMRLVLLNVRVVCQLSVIRLKGDLLTLIYSLQNLHTDYCRAQAICRPLCTDCVVYSILSVFHASDYNIVFSEGVKSVKI